MPSRTIANSLARNSTERAPASTLGSLKTPDSKRLYHKRKPSRSHIKTFRRSPRRERKTNRWPARGSCPITALTRSAKRSKPQRISTASEAIQIRAPCARSSACKLGRPVKRASPAQPARPADDGRRSRVPPARCARRRAGSQWPGCATLLAAPAPRPVEPALPRSVPCQPGSAASSKRRSGSGQARVHGRTPPRFGRSGPAPLSTRATSTTSLVHALACLKREAGGG